MKTFFSLIVTTGLLLSQTINEQIYALEDASPEMRVELMNSIKQQLMSMNQERRMKTIGILQKRLQVKPSQQEQEHHHLVESQHEHNHKATRGLHLKQHEVQEQMMHRSHGENSRQHQSFGNHRANGEAEGHNGRGSSNSHNGRR